jgi:hypothetical protein
MCPAFIAEGGALVDVTVAPLAPELAGQGRRISTCTFEIVLERTRRGPEWSGFGKALLSAEVDLDHFEGEQQMRRTVAQTLAPMGVELANSIRLERVKPVIERLEEPAGWRRASCRTMSRGSGPYPLLCCAHVWVDFRPDVAGSSTVPRAEWRRATEGLKRLAWGLHSSVDCARLRAIFGSG